ncbi:hypothetical protein [Acinetobacter sp.]|uniref:hypothetical protein n=1 Tax=Acinetobacter sp. TaxID=472 RepID=UPI003753C600
MYYFDLITTQLLKADKIEPSAGQEIKFTAGDVVRYVNKSLIGATPEEAMNRANKNARDNEAYYKKTVELAQAQFESWRDNCLRLGEYISNLYGIKE